MIAARHRLKWSLVWRREVHDAFFIINQHDMKHHFYADDSQLQNSSTPENITSLFAEASSCYADIQNWMTQNKLQLNGDKTEAMLVGTKNKLASVTLNTIQLGDNIIPLCGD